MQLSFKRSSGQFSKYSDSGPKILVYKYHEIDFWCNKIDGTIFGSWRRCQMFFLQIGDNQQKLDQIQNTFPISGIYGI